MSAGPSPSSYLVFSLGLEECAVPLREVRSVTLARPCIPVPYMPSYHRGLINLRGEIISVIDLGAKLRIERPYEPVEPTIIILGGPARQRGILVDSVNRVIDLDDPASARAAERIQLLDASRIVAGEPGDGGAAA